MSWDHEPRRDEPLQQEVGKHRSRKDTRRWCKGKVGREHVIDTMATRYGSCHAWQRWRHPAGEALGVWSWSCNHWLCCSACGKRMDKVGADQCPDRPAQLPEPTLHPRLLRKISQ